MAEPVVTLVSPPEHTALLPGQEVVVDVVDEDGLGYYALLVRYPQLRTTEVAYDAAAPQQATRYNVRSTAITNGRRFYLSRRGGWPAPPTVRVRVLDLPLTNGLEASVEVSPAEGTALLPQQPVSITIEDDTGTPDYVLIYALYGGSRQEVVYDELALESSNYVVEVDGSTYTITPAGRWPGAPTLRVRVVEGPPELTLEAPLGGEELLIGQSTDIEWDVVGAFDSFTVELSTNGGSSWSTLASGLSSASRSLSWTPSVASAQNRVRVTGDGVVLRQATSSNFTTFALSVQVTAPNGGEQLRQGQSTNITWTADGPFTSFTIERSENSLTGPWTTIASGIDAADRSYAWTPSVLTTLGRIRVTGVYSPSASDTSDGSFSVLAPWSLFGSQLFFRAQDATGATNVTSQSDLAGGAALTKAGTPWMVRQGGGNRYGATSGLAYLQRGGYSRAGGTTHFSIVMRAMALNSNGIDGLGVWFDANFNQNCETRLRVSSTHIVFDDRSIVSGPLALASYAHGGITIGTAYTFGATYSLGTVRFYLNGAFLGSVGGLSGNPASIINGKVHIGARDSTSPDVSDVTCTGAFIGGMIAAGGTAMSDSDHAYIHSWFVANAAP